jgi:hypothetical protein
MSARIYVSTEELPVSFGDPTPHGDAERRVLVIKDDLAAELEIIRQTHRYVDLFKVGRANYVGLTKTTDWKQFTADVLEVLAETGARHYIKKDLQPYLPPGYSNPMRIAQHH